VRVLVVEDDPTIASFVVKGLQGAGFTVDHATSGGDALHLASSGDYAVAVVDVMLPGMDGRSPRGQPLPAADRARLRPALPSPGSGAWLPRSGPGGGGLQRMWYFCLTTRPLTRRARYHDETSFMGTNRRSSLR
jgi:hypothetical protein